MKCLPLDHAFDDRLKNSIIGCVDDLTINQANPIASLNIFVNVLQ
jgi:hypothetical protein